MMQGDPRLVLGPDGSKLVFRGGQPVMDMGLENAVLIALFTSNGWCGNSLLRNGIGSDFEEKCNQPITRKSLNEIRDAAERALRADIFGKVQVVVKNISGNRIDVGILLRRSSVIVALTRNSGAWVYQTVDPAYLRLKERQYAGGSATVVVPPDAFNQVDIPFNINDWGFNV